MDLRCFQLYVKAGETLVVKALRVYTIVHLCVAIQR